MDAEALYELIIKLKEQLRDLSFRHFLQFELFSPNWWVLIALIVFLLAIWWWKVDKKRLFEISMFGLFVGLFATILDVMGTDYCLWAYRVHVIPETAVLIPVDFIVLPSIQMYVYQQCPKWGKYMLFSLITAIFQSFIAEPLAILIGQYKLLTWNIIYSFPIYLIIDVSVKLVVECFKKRQEKEINKDYK